MSTLKLKAASSGEVQLTVPSTIANQTIIFPAAAPTAGKALKATNTSGTLEWGSIDIANLSASGTASSSTFLRGDNTWATPTDNGKIIQVKQTRKKDTVTNSVAHSTWETLELAGSITPASANNTIRVQMVANVGQSSTHFSGYSIYREINGGAAAQLTGYLGDADGNRTRTAQSTHHNPANQDNQIILDYLDDISSWTSGAITYTLYGHHGEHAGAVTMYLNRGNYDNDHQQVSRPMSTVTLTEIASGGWSVA